MPGINKAHWRRLKLVALFEWAIMSYGVLLLIQIMRVFILLVLFA
ncbi:MAG TPA: hypothetical protein VM911_13410 [Pyrinomonadaceae bacterium]|nr:hypothetical protein [Pyrinomonadaceae bacterium]